MKKALPVLIVIVIISAGAWYYFRQPTAPSNTNQNNTSPSSAMPVIGGSTNEIIVNNEPPPAPPDQTPSPIWGVKIFNLTAKKFAFSQTEIKVKQGDTVTINFSSTDGFHDWVIDEFNARTKQVNPGEPTSVTFTADKTGMFEYYCSVGNHRAMGMKGNLIVE